MQVSSVNERRLQGGIRVGAVRCRIDRLVRLPFSGGGLRRIFRSSAEPISSERHLQNELPADISAKMLCLTAGSA